jgi:hypothetical protein
MLTENDSDANNLERTTYCVLSRTSTRPLRTNSGSLNVPRRIL